MKKSLKVNVVLKGRQGSPGMNNKEINLKQVTISVSQILTVYEFQRELNFIVSLQDFNFLLSL